MKFFSRLFKRKKNLKPKLGLALGSGGAKGFAELGAMRAFEENGIEFEIIGGTSIGSIIGAFYANGYSSTDIEHLIKSIDFSDIKSLLMIKMDTDKMFKTIDNTVGNLLIEELKKPFCAIATEVETGDEIVFKTGSVADALSASASYPPFFKPHIIDGKRYIDGAFTNSVPADRVKEMGADFVVAIDLANHEPKGSFLNTIFPTYKNKVDKPWQKGMDSADVYIHPDLTGYKSTSIGQANEMYDIGYRAGVEAVPQIKEYLSNKKKK